MSKRLDFEFDIDDDMIDSLAEAIVGNIKKESKGFDEIVNLWEAAVRRECYIGTINPGIGMQIESMIRFWNEVDAKNNVPIEKRKPILIYIDSEGGSLTDSYTIIDAIKNSKTPVWTIAAGCAYSGGFFTFIAGHRRIAYPHASFLYHEGATQTGGTAGQFQNYAQFYKKQLDQLKDIVLTNTNITEDEYRDMRKDDVWYTAEEALEKGICDEIGVNYEI